tara:strand:- start:25 stop:954 length:930 start_codon:yes stop_codon:yes gene_type:complete
MNKKNILSVKNLNKTYEKKGSAPNVAIENLNLNVQQGEIFGLLGPNGAGKTTFINILAGSVIKSSGEVEVWGFDLDKNPRQVRASIGIVAQEINVDPFFTPENLLDLQAGLYGIKKKNRITSKILNLVSLQKQANSYSRSLSGGMKRRLMVAKSLVHQPPIIILDEPTAGVDVELRKNLWENVKTLNQDGATVILTTHYLEEAEKMCDRIGILNKGNLVALDTTKKLLEKIKIKKVFLKLSGKTNINVKKFKTLKILSSTDNEISLSYDKNELEINQIIKLIEENGTRIQDLSTDDGDLEDVFLSLTKS